MTSPDAECDERYGNELLYCVVFRVTAICTRMSLPHIDIIQRRKNTSRCFPDTTCFPCRASSRLVGQVLCEQNEVNLHSDILVSANGVRSIYLRFLLGASIGVAFFGDTRRMA